MSEASAIAEAALRARRDRVHTTMLIELLALLTFMAMAFAFVSREETEANPLAQQVRELKAQLQDARKEIVGLETKIQGLERLNDEMAESIRRLAGQRDMPLPANDKLVVIPQKRLESLTADVANSKAMVDERQKESAQLRNELRVARGGGGADLPNCTVTAGFLISVDLLGDGALVVRPLWQAGSAASVQRVPGATELASSRPISTARFAQLAQQVAAWGRTQSTPCGFRAQVTERHSNLELYKRQVRAVERYFYVRRN